MAPSENLRTLALQTGGREVLDTNDLRGGLRRITSDLSAYYLLGYYSTNTKFDGKYRKIAVRVRRPGVDVTARRGYLAPTPAMFKAATSTRPTLEPAPPPAVPLIGEPATFVVHAGNAPARVRDLEFRRTDRIRIEWPRLRALDRREARLLDRNGQPIPVPLTITEPESTPPVLALDLPLASFSAGTYIIELVVGGGADVQTVRVTILVTR